MLIGVDPGFSGGVAVLSEYGEFLGGIRMPFVQASPKRKVIDFRALEDWLVWQKPLGDEKCTMVIEGVSARPGQGVSSVFTFGLATGAVEAWAVQRGPTHWVTPAVWKKALNLSSDKKASLDKARVEFGANSLWTVKANDGVAEAALIALYWHRTQRN